ncbi:MAG: GspH/FimT family pseudopilin [Thiohalocapsa sp.]|uniref:GspH/FimT family pseudopilin n=1 Tax=Thiohalocapsa sp. TaxID=2497641 RepID=UPI0025D8D58C|nr:GspH/FimT family pseudopilin [Thiohalocapsa sp.]MCG6940547.1 GspH/FimT family pseudopilin [Thiohalocapsa sp.]
MFRPAHSQKRSSQKGINIVELLIVICILAISLTLGIPGFQALKLRSDRSAALIELVSAVRLARSEAALRGTPVSICASTDGARCSAADDWSGGWLVFQDPDQNLVVESAAQVIRVVRFEHVRFTLTADQDIDGGITFGTFGFSRPTAGAFSYADAFETRDIALTYLGRLYVTDTEPSS